MVVPPKELTVLDRPVLAVDTARLVTLSCSCSGGI